MELLEKNITDFFRLVLNLPGRGGRALLQLTHNSDSDQVQLKNLSNLFKLFANKQADFFLKKTLY